MKMAMIAIQAGLPKISPQSKLILQVHDELVLEVPKNDEKKVANFIKTSMENIYTLTVPLVVDIESGDNWGNLEKIK
jgi:DNA polymerase-1